MPKFPLRLSCAALAAVLAAPIAAAHAAPQSGAVLVVDRQGVPVGVLVPAVAQPDPMLVQMMAMQQAMMQEMQASFGGAATTQAMDDAAAMPSGVTISTFSSSSDGCSRTMVWRQGAGDPAPKLLVDQVAERCAASPARAPQAVQDPGAVPGQGLPRLQTIVDRHVPVGRSFTPF